MRINPNIVLSQKTVTILNKLKRVDSATNSDEWVKHSLQNCVWIDIDESSANGTDVSSSNKIQVHIPSNQMLEYKQYDDWKSDTSNSFTISQGDYLIVGEVDENITSMNITKVLSGYQKVCKVRLFEDLTFSGIETSGFLQQYADMYYVEGV